MPTPINEQETPEQLARDEALGVELDRRLELLRTGRLSQGQSSSAGGLESVVDQLHELAVFVSTSVTRGSTVDAVNAAGAETGDYTPYTRSFAKSAEPAVSGTIGKYEIRRVLGQGGQGSALLVFDPDLRRHVVLKLYHGSMGSEGQTMLLGEGRALARVRSPYVAQCFAIEQLDGSPYLVVEYIPGQSLNEILLKGRPERDWALRVTRQLAEGLAVIHACGLLHRDIKPSNIIIGDDGQPRLVDFGLATHLASDQLRRVSGTLAYMAPEQARGEHERIDARTDLFGLGAVLYEMLTGAPPRHGLSRQALMELAQRGDIVPASQKNPDLSPELNALCTRCLAKEPAQRFASAHDLMRAIDELAPPNVSWFAALESRFGKVGARAALAAAGLLVVAIPVALWAAFRDTEQPSPLPNPGLAQAGQPNYPGPSGRTVTKTVDRPLKKDFAVTLKLIDQPMPPANPEGSKESETPARGLRVETAKEVTDALRLIEGDAIALTIEVERDAYVGIWSVDHLGNATQLFPSKYDPDHLVLAGQPRRVPGDRTVPIRVEKQLGPEHVHVLASTRRWSPLVGERGPDSVFSTFTSPDQKQLWQDTVRGLAIGDHAVSELIIPLEVKPKKP